MTRFVVLSLGFLGWGFYELSSGADFVLDVATVAEISAPSQVEEPAQVDELVAQTPVVKELTAESVSRADTEMLLSVAASFEPETVDEPGIVEVIVSPNCVARQANRCRGACKYSQRAKYRLCCAGDPVTWKQSRSP